MNETQTLTLEAGKYYRTRDGRKAYIVGQNPFDKDDADIGFPFGGFVRGGNGDCLEWWRGDGRFEVREDAMDLVAEWVEPKRIKGFIALKYTGNSFVAVTSHVHGTLEEAMKMFKGDTSAIVEIDILEGVGLNGEAA